MKNSFASSRTGKIARLPHSLRDQLNRRLRENEPAKTILPWLNALPEVKALLAAQFDSCPISKQNLSEWKSGGFRDWVILQDSLEFAKSLDTNQDLGDSAPADFTDKLARWLTLQYASATRALNADLDPTDRWTLLRDFCADISRLRRSQFYSQLLQIKRDRLAFDQSNVESLKEKEFWEWTKRPEIAQKLNPPLQKGLTQEVIQELQNKLQIL